MDEVIFEEFKGTGNSEIVLDRKIADKRVFRQLIFLSLVPGKKTCLLTRVICRKPLSCAVFSIRWVRQIAIEFLLSKLKQTKTNGEFFDSMNT